VFAFCGELANWDALTTLEKQLVISKLVDVLTIDNVAYLRRHPQTPRLYRTDVRYCPDKRGSERQWWDIRRVLQNGCADCKALAAYRCAELVVAGYPAETLVTTRDGVTFHVVVRAGTTLEDPSARLGMHGS